MTGGLEDRSPAGAQHITTTSAATNNFGILRLGFSTLVLVSHAFPLTRGTNVTEPLARLTGMTFGELSVNCFFLISGYLITQSWHRSRSAATYVRKRILRIYPGYLVAFSFSVVVGLISSSSAALEYAKRLYWYNDTLLRNLIFLDYGVLNGPTAFPQNPYPHSVNGSLWTLQPELACYLVLMALGILGVLSKPNLVRGLLFLCYAAFVVYECSLGSAANSMWRFLTYFLVGSVVTGLPANVTQLKAWRFGVAIAALALSAYVPLLFTLLFPVLGAYLVFAIAGSRITPGAALFARVDLSYGMYLYAFPIEQLCVQFAGIKSPLALMVMSLPITAALAAASWFFVEKPAQRLKFSSGAES